MQPQRRPDSVRSSESLEASLRALPQPPVPGDLEARILAAIPTSASNEMPRLASMSRRWRLVVWASASVAMATACLLAVRFWPESSGNYSTPVLVAGPEKNEAPHHVTPHQPRDSHRNSPLLNARLDVDETEAPNFTWPIQEKAPLMVSSSSRLDLLD